MTDPKWQEAFSNAFFQLFEFWEWRASIGSAFAVICNFMGMEKALVYLLFGTLTLDMCVRIVVLIMRRRSVCRGMKHGLPRYLQYLAFIVLAWLAQLALELSTGIRMPMIDLVMGWLVFTDLASIIGHLHFLGWHVPAPITFIVNGGKRNIWRRTTAAFPPNDAPQDISSNMPREPYTPAEHPHRRAEDEE